jgi:hypothetical protein
VKIPRGLDEIIEAYGDPFKIMGDDGVMQAPERAEWESRLVTVALPAPIQLSWSLQKVSRIRCHQAVSERFHSAFRALYAEPELWRLIKTYGGCYEFRTKRRDGTALSVHSWGIAIDLNPGTNRQGTAGDMHPGIVQVFEAHDFTWGGRWRNEAVDPMHFQACTGF